MKTNIENLPNEIFDWIELGAFKNLSRTQKNLVLEYMSQKEYDEMHEGFQQVHIQGASKTEINITKHHAHIMQAWDQQYEQKSTQFQITTVWLWKAAAILFAISTLLLGYKNYSNQIQSHVLVKHDTLFIEKAMQAPLQLAYDTMAKLLPSKAQNNTIAAQVPLRNTYKRTHKLVSNMLEKKQTASNAPELHIVNLSTINRIENQTRHTSKKDDSLEKNFKFASL